MDEEMKAQIEQLRANRAGNSETSAPRMKRDKENSRSRAFQRDMEMDDILFSNEDEEETPKKDEGVIGVFLFQCILAVTIAIIYILLMTFNQPVSQDIRLTIVDKSQNDFSFKDKVYATVGNIVTYLNELQPISMDGDLGEESTTSEEMSDEAMSDGVSEQEKATSDNPSSEASEPESEPPVSTEEGAGGAVNPVESNTLPANATLVPVIFTGKITFPIVKEYSISSQFGFRNHPSSGVAEFHTALDIATKKGTPVIAAASGTVIRSGKDSSLGNFIIIDHANGFLTVYGHCDKLIAKEGTRVREGDIIAKVGSTGDSTGNHLHFGMKKDGLYFDPAYVFEDEAKADD